VTRAVLPERLKWRPGAVVAKALVPVTRVGGGHADARQGALSRKKVDNCIN
jgi:hypothetical protein